MLVSSPDKKRKDYLDFSGDLSEVTTETNIRNVNLFSLSDRTVIDMMSSRDSEITVDKLIGALKTYFDIILVDLGHELTNINTHTAIKCNKIIGVADQSLKSVYHLQKSINTMATLAIPLAKANKVVLNKTLTDVNSNTAKVIEDAGLVIIGEIPFSLEIAKHGVTGKRIYTKTTNNNDIHSFSSVIDLLVDDLVQETPLNAKYTNKKLVEEAKALEKSPAKVATVVTQHEEPTASDNFVIERPTYNPDIMETSKPPKLIKTPVDDDEDDINETIDI
jgi:hypothetical protein